ncbi:MAG TPA: zinc ribbon domain-containing protein [Candidatus Lokiarchaeia archaeon]|nr:zinc ribbon domain-containing protein [Candidatus Lokiarchaeia archaeon]
MMMSIFFWFPFGGFGYFYYYPIFTVFIVAIIAVAVVSIVLSVTRNRAYMRAQRFPQGQPPSQDDFARYNGSNPPDMSQPYDPNPQTQAPPSPGFKSEIPRGPTLSTKWQGPAMNPTTAQGARYCPVCGVEVGGDARFCQNCGADITRFMI